MERADHLERFHDLMPYRVRKILLVASPYDSFILEEDGQLNELILAEFLDLNLRNAPLMTRVSTGGEALAMVRQGGFDLVISLLRLGDMHIVDFARKVREQGVAVPIVLLAFDSVEMNALRDHHDLKDIDRLFMWQGDFRILLAIVKDIEDRRNVESDTKQVGVSTIILIEDSVRYYSSFLPMIYTELLKQSQNVIAEGVNLTHKLMRMAARPKILLASTYEEAEAWYRKYHLHMLGVISDLNFPRNGKSMPRAGLEFARMIREEDKDLPILLQSRDPEIAGHAREVGADVVLKGSPVLLQELRRFIRDRFCFGDFVFTLPDGTEVGRASDLRGLEEALGTVPDASILFHAERNGFSGWLRARTEFGLARAIRPIQVSEFPTPEDLRRYLVRAIRTYQSDRQGGALAVFHPGRFDPNRSFARIGGGSLGGKARGLAFIRRVLHSIDTVERFPGVRIFVPPAVVLGTDVFDQFLEANDLRDFALKDSTDAEIERRFLDARLPEEAYDSLVRYLERVDYPLAVRSSGLLEDSQHLPSAGIYKTYMVPNNHPDSGVRIEDLVRAVQRVYASTFFQAARNYVYGTPYRLEEEKMAVLIQRLVGRVHEDRFYPDMAGVACSTNYYPVPPMNAEDGVVSVALGLGATVVEGGRAIRFCPRYPRHQMSFTSPAEILENAQTEFFALKLDDPSSRPDTESELVLELYPMATALKDGTLHNVGSTYSAENDAVYDGIGRKGVPLVTFAPVLKHGLFPLAETIDFLLNTAREGLNHPVEIEFAANIAPGEDEAGELGFLQMRPLVVNPVADQVSIQSYPPGKLACMSRRVLGNGRIDDIRDLVIVDRENFDRKNSADTAATVGRFAMGLSRERIPFVLIGVGRWGASDPWLGIPVTWEQIAGVRVIVEASFKGVHVEPSQGSHFFHNLTASRAGYFTVDADRDDEFVDWDWLGSLPAERSEGHVRHVRIEPGVTILMSGKDGFGVIVKPEGPE